MMIYRAIILVLSVFSLELVSPARALAEKTVIFVGGSPQGSAEALNQLRRRLTGQNPDDAIVVFTGNYTEVGDFPREGDRQRAVAEGHVRAHVDVVRDFVVRGGQAYFLPGHRDYRRGHDPVRRLRDFVNSELRRALAETPGAAERAYSFDAMPKADCGDPYVVEFNSTIAIALLNSAWWMQDWKKLPDTNQGCDVKSRSEFEESFNSLTKAYRTRRLLVAMHHPLESLGPYGGNFDSVEHLMPPVFGTLAIWARKIGLVPEYRNHVMFNSFASALKTSADTFGRFVFVSGHDASLQLLDVDEQVQVIAGHSGESPTRVDDPDDGEFTAESSGWAEVHLDDSGEGHVVLVDGISGGEVFRRDLPAIVQLARDNLPPPPPLPEGPVKSTYTKRRVSKTSTFQGWFVGDFYRDAYTLELEFDVIDVESMEGGLTPTSIGGGSQTNSIRFVGSEGTEWSARAATKDSTRYLPYPFNQVRPIRHFLEEGFTGIHPAAATIVPTLAEAIDVLHTKPRLMYLPDQQGLGNFRGFIGDEVVLLERRVKAPREGELPEHLGGGLSPSGPTVYRDTRTALDFIREQPWKHQIDQEAWLRARLLDILLGDWDRHEDQWRYATLSCGDGRTRYLPIPGDRDQAASHYDGVTLFFARLAIPEMRRLRPFGADIDDLTWLTFNARPVDALFLSGLGKDRWMAIAREVQSKITDEVIAQGMKSWPRSAYELDGREIEEKLRSRRDQLVDAAERFFYQVNKALDLLGSEGPDKIELIYADDDDFTIRMVGESPSASSKPFFERTFHSEETEEIRIYGLAGDDRFSVSGKPHAKTKIRFVGGSGADRVSSEGNQQRSARALALYDRDDGAQVDAAISIDDERSGDPYRNQYDFDDPHHKPTRAAGFPSALLNADDGLLLRGSGGVVTSGFKRAPYAASHTFSAAVATTTAGVRAKYFGAFPETLGSLDQELSLSGTTPLYTRNFFGFTSEFIEPAEAPGGRDFYRLRQSSVELGYGLSARLLRDTLRVGIRGLGEFIDIEDTEGRFVRVSDDVEPLALQSRVFVGAQGYAQFSTLDNASYPKRGFIAELLSSVRTDSTTGTDQRIGTSGLFALAAGTYIPFDRSQRVVLSTRIKLQHIVGEFPFYDAPTLSDHDLRAYNDEQLSGNSVFAQTNDLRVELLRFRKGLPGTVGVSAGFDHGLAFGSLVETDHYNLVAGGSFFWNILDLIGFQVGYYRGFDRGSRLTIGLGRLFSENGFTL